ncbi:MAG TPA: NAD(P)H-dependent glycerol-3-phosphate dehydrogenase [Polyangia bacterium]|jgi:glycerol-3-phosphate dehydrogenase (NAD(P)+)
MAEKPAVAVLGGGAWGGVLAGLAARHGHDVALWEIDGAAAAALARDRVSPRSVPGFKLPVEVAVSSDIAAAVAGRDLVVVAVPSGSIGATMRAAAATTNATAPARAPIVACASKGLDPERGATMDEMIALAWPGARVAVLSGPSFAAEIARGLPAALVAASHDPEAAAVVQACFGGDRLRVYTSRDVTGVCVGGALKNVIAIAVGCCDGLGFGDNARAALITRGLAETGRLAERMGGQALTLAGLAGLGDLVLTCTGDLSRNRQVGLALARGEALGEILGRLGHIAEGVGTARVAHDLAQRLGVDMPITREVAAVLHDGKPPRAAVHDLLARDIGAER